MKKKSPCIDCINRYPGCQGKCEQGIAYSKKLKEQREAIKAAKSYEGMINNYKIARIAETKQRLGIK
ncbi:MAG: hypothetical protein ACOX4P_07750 [Anaerovoracaceae bacterium]|jgi:hypothetical protein